MRISTQPLHQGWRTYLLSWTTCVMHYRWWATKAIILS